MRSRRFSVADIEARPLRLTGDQAAHARVLRLQAGDPVVVFDASGREARGHIEAIKGDAFVIAIDSVAACGAHPPVTLHLAVAAPKAARGDWLVEKCAELGVAELHLLETVRGTVFPRPAKLDRWRRKAVEAAKQCGRARPMEIHAPASMGAIHALCGDDVDTSYGDASAQATLMEALQRQNSTSDRPLLIYVGPEGGFTAQERQALTDLGATAVSMGATTLRIETAAIAAAAVVAAWAASRKA